MKWGILPNLNIFRGQMGTMKGNPQFLLLQMPVFNTTPAFSQDNIAGVIIKDFGKVFTIENTDFVNKQ